MQISVATAKYAFQIRHGAEFSLSWVNRKMEALKIKVSFMEANRLRFIDLYDVPFR